MNRIACIIAVLITSALLQGNGATAADDATGVDPQYTWDLTELYPTVEDWESARKQVMEDFGKIRNNNKPGYPSIPGLLLFLICRRDCFVVVARLTHYKSGG